LNISIIIPCYNEQDNIDYLVNRSKKILKNKKNQLILVNNGSTDLTKIKIIKNNKKYKNIKLINIKNNIGFGDAIKKGVNKCTNSVIGYTHADREVDINDINKGLKILKKKDFIEENFFIKGYRVNKIKNGWSLGDIILSSLMSLFYSLLFRKILNEIHAQPVIFHKNFFKKERFFPNGLTFDASLYIKAKQNNLKIIRFPVKFNKKIKNYGIRSNDTFIKNIKNSLNQIIGGFYLFFKYI
jgi:glycosyltransferase involved in cell wall biosynthesis